MTSDRVSYQMVFFSDGFLENARRYSPSTNGPAVKTHAAALDAKTLLKLWLLVFLWVAVEYESSLYIVHSRTSKLANYSTFACQCLIFKQLTFDLYRSLVGTYYRYDEELVVPIVENTPFEQDLEVCDRLCASRFSSRTFAVCSQYWTVQYTHRSSGSSVCAGVVPRLYGALPGGGLCTRAPPRLLLLGSHVAAGQSNVRRPALTGQTFFVVFCGLSCGVCSLAVFSF